ncbi:hypothetical protein COCC4DRAFT_123647, partial [Bipolaris maydis ATCC 48331]
DGQEVTYNELLAGTGANKRGYAKICFCGERAAADGLDYFWVDLLHQECRPDLNVLQNVEQLAARIDGY